MTPPPSRGRPRSGASSLAVDRIADGGQRRRPASMCRRRGAAPADLEAMAQPPARAIRTPDTRKNLALQPQLQRAYGPFADGEPADHELVAEDGVLQDDGPVATHDRGQLGEEQARGSAASVAGWPPRPTSREPGPGRAGTGRPPAGVTSPRRVRSPPGARATACAGAGTGSGGARSDARCRRGQRGEGEALTSPMSRAGERDLAEEADRSPRSARCRSRRRGLRPPCPSPAARPRSDVARLPPRRAGEIAGGASRRRWRRGRAVGQHPSQRLQPAVQEQAPLRGRDERERRGQEKQAEEGSHRGRC